MLEDFELQEANRQLAKYFRAESKAKHRHGYPAWKEKHLAAGSILVWPYHETIASETEAMREPATEAQIRYINLLSSRDSDAKAILDSVSEGAQAEDLTKGQAMYVIKCLLREIYPTVISGSMLDQIYKQDGTYWDRVSGPQESIT